MTSCYLTYDEINNKWSSYSVPILCLVQISTDSIQLVFESETRSGVDSSEASLY